MSTLDIAAANHYFVYDGKPSYDFKCIAYADDNDSSPVKGYTAESIPGRNGDILLPMHQFGNVAQSYHCIIYDDFDTNYDALRAFLLSREGYCRLSDTVHPDEFYHAYFAEAIEPELTRNRKMGKFRLIFTRKPQRWLISGDTAITVHESGSWVNGGAITNPTQFPCYPLLYLYGSSLASGGEFYFGYTGKRTTPNLAEVSTGSTYINTYGLYIDMETLVSYNSQKRGTYSTTTMYGYNQYLSYSIDSGNKYPYQIPPGDSTFSGSSAGLANVAEIKVKPRWFRI